MNDEIKSTDPFLAYRTITEVADLARSIERRGANIARMKNEAICLQSNAMMQEKELAHDERRLELLMSGIKIVPDHVDPDYPWEPKDDSQ